MLKVYGAEAQVQIMLSLSLEPFATLDEPAAGEIVAFDVDYTGTPCITTATRPLDSWVEGGGGAKFVKTQGQAAQGYRVYLMLESSATLMASISREAFNIHHTQPLPDGRVLLVCGRCHYNAGKPEKNGRLYSSAGELLHEITLGDGIESVQADKSGRIWTSYFDEGVFGNFGWSQPLGSPGLVAWSPEGSKLYEYCPLHGLDHICDCYAMNVTNEDVWTCYYTEFPLVQIRDSKVVSYWQMPLSGSHAFAVQRSHALFAGGYNEQNHYRLFDLRDGKVKLLRECKVRDREGQPIHADRTIGRGDSIFMLRGRDVFRLSIEQVL